MIDYLGGDLPVEIMALILYKHKGLMHPCSQMIKSYFRDLDDEFNIYKHIQKIREDIYIDDYYISQNISFKINIKDYPRLFFDPGDFDIVEEQLIKKILKK
jgi:hypothetical protein